MIDTLNTILSSPLVALLVIPFLVSLVARKVGSVQAHLDKQKTLQELEDNPFVYKGAHYAGILNEAGDAFLCGPCILVQLEYGRVTIMRKDDGHLMNWSGEEWKKLHPVWIKPGTKAK